MSKINPYSIEILEVAQDIIECLLEQDGEPLNPSEISRKLGLNRSRIFRVLKSLEGRGYIVSLTNGFTLGFKFLEIVDKMGWENEQYLFAKSALLDLAKSTGDVAHLFVRTGDHAICAARSSGNNRLQVEKTIGEHIPMNVPAAPLVLLAFLPEKERENIVNNIKMIAYTVKTITDRDVLRCRLNQIRSQGYAIDNEEFEIGAYAVSAPIVDKLGLYWAAISVDIPTIRINEERRAQIIELVVDVARQISAKSGYLPG